LHFALRFIGRPPTLLRRSKKPYPPDQEKSHAHDLKNPANNTQEEECCIEAFEENLRLTGSDFQTG
jgi:hypothetical protein